jgi:hypothetical protein
VAKFDTEQTTGKSRVLCRAGLDVLLELHRAATGRGTQLHITSGGQTGCFRVLQRLHQGAASPDRL